MRVLRVWVHSFLLSMHIFFICVSGYMCIFGFYERIEFVHGSTCFGIMNASKAERHFNGKKFGLFVSRDYQIGWENLDHTRIFVSFWKMKIWTYYLPSFHRIPGDSQCFYNMNTSSFQYLKSFQVFCDVYRFWLPLKVLVF